MYKTKMLAAAILLLTTACCIGQGSQPVTDYLKVPGPMLLNNTSFNLVWSAHPSEAYYKQEYIPKSEKVEKYTKMVMVEVLLGNTKAAALAKAKLDELKQLKLTNPVVNFNSYQKNGEIIIDFLLSENGADDKVNIIERNVYRYKDIKETNGKTGVLLFAASERAYDHDVDAFLSSLQKNKATLTSAVAAFTMPAITIKP